MKIATINIYDLPISFRNKQNDLSIVEKFCQDNNVELAFIQEMNFLKPSLTTYKAHFNPGIISRSGGLCVLSKESLDINFIPFNNQRVKSSIMTLGDSILTKGFQYFRFKDILFINLHLASTYSNTEDENNLIESQIDQLSEFINNIEGKIVICGDFNIPPTHKAISNFLLKNRLEDYSRNIPITLSTKNTNRQTYIHNRLKHLQDIRVDYILGRNVTIENCSLVFNELYKGKNISDHFGLSAELK